MERRMIFWTSTLQPCRSLCCAELLVSTALTGKGSLCSLMNSGHLGNEMQQPFSFAKRSCTAAKSMDLAGWQEELSRLQLPLLSYIQGSPTILLLAEARASPGDTCHWVQEDLG